jgi:hypothetical protein
MPEPLDKELYEQVRKYADLVYDKPSAYKSGFIVKTYKEYGGKYKGKPDNEGLDRWFDEKWEDIGNDEDKYPTFRPTIRVSDKTPITKGELDYDEKRKKIKEKQKIKGRKNLQPFVSKEKKERLEKYSDPTQVFKKAREYLGKDVDIQISGRKDKKYMVKTPEGKWVHFGGFKPPMEDFTKHKDNKRRENYLNRATKIKGDWKKNKYSPNNLSIHILW